MLIIAQIALIYAGVLLLFLLGVFVLAQLLKDNSVMDIAYGPAFVVASGGTLLLTQTLAPLPIVIFMCMLIWATRLSVRILIKNWGTPEDARYAKWREKWMQRGYTYFLARSFIQIQLLQGLIIYIVSFPFILSVAAGEALSLPFVYVGLSIFAIGLVYETIADLQLDDFLRRKRAGTEDATLMKEGLFRYSRRPNYFGETLIWWGMAFMTASLPLGWLGFASPIVITYIVTQVTGPMLERQFLERHQEKYRAYMAATNYFIPGPPRL